VGRGGNVWISSREPVTFSTSRMASSRVVPFPEPTLKAPEGKGSAVRAVTNASIASSI
jgi:hypothetical protein